MKNTDQQNPDDGKHQPQKPLNPITLPQRDSVTSLQVGTLLNIGMAVMGVLLHPTRDQEDPKWKDQKQLDGGVLNSAETTFINVCAKLDEIIADKSRWDFNSQNVLEEKLSQVYSAHIEFSKAQTEAVNNLNLPHRKFQPTLVNISGGSWAAVFGNMTKLEDCVIGVGPTPALALQDFDAMFTKPMPAHLIEVLKQTEKQNEIKPVDERTDEPARETPKRRKVRSRNRKRTGSDSQSG